MLSNCGHDSRGQYSGDVAGDQGGEWTLIPWYNYPYGGWNYVLRHPSQAVRYYIKEFAIQAAQNDNIGYDQSNRNSFWEQLTVSGYYPMNIKVPCEADCSSGVLAIVKAVGYVVGDNALKNVSQYGYTGNERAILSAAGFEVLNGSAYLTSDNYLYAGDILLNEENHTCICVTNGAYVQDSTTEKNGNNDDKKTPIQLQAIASESLYQSDGSASWVNVDFYITSIDSPAGTYSSGDITSSTSVTQTIACGLNGQSTIYTLNSTNIANAINKFGDKYLVASLGIPVHRNENGNAIVRITSSGTFTWLPGSPLRTLDMNYSCIKLKFTMTYNANGGSLGNVPSVAYRYRGYPTAITSAAPTRSGYRFLGWSTTANGNVEYQYGDVYQSDADVVLYAVWGAEITASNISITSTGAIEIPGREYTIAGSGKYVFCDHTYYYNLNYDITNVLTAIDPSNPLINKIFTSVSAKPYYTDSSGIHLESSAQNITKSKGIVSVALSTIAKAISYNGSTSSVPIGVRFSFVKSGVTQTVDKTINISLKNFSFVDVSFESIAYNPANSNEYLVRLRVTYPSSFGVIRTKNLYPYIRYGTMSQNNVLTYISREDISTGVSIFTYKASTSAAPSTLTIKWIGDILTYETSWSSSHPQSGKFSKETSIVVPTSPSKTITIFSDGTCEAGEFIESTYTQGFFKGGVVSAKQLSETSRIALLPSGFEFGEIKES